jgi:hypothetical protein
MKDIATYVEEALDALLTAPTPDHPWTEQAKTKRASLAKKIYQRCLRRLQSRVQYGTRHGQSTATLRALMLAESGIWDIYQSRE